MRPIRESLLILAVGGGLACSSYPTTKAVPIDCNVEAAYDFQVIDNFDTVGAMPLTYNAGDTPAYVTDVIETIPDGDRCGSTAALVMRSAHNNDWGSIFALNFGSRDASAYEGLSFWARAPGATTKGFTMLLDDPNTANPTPSVGGVDPNPTDSNCLTTMGVDGGQAMNCYDAVTGQLMPCGTTTSPSANACGNSYTVMVVVTTDWRFYTIPFREFQQGPMPNQVPNPLLTMRGSTAGTNLLTDRLVGIILRMQREATMELWFDNLRFYRPKATGTDAGS